MSDYQTAILDNINQLDEQVWDSLNDSKHPFLSYSFLAGLETCDCIHENTGWIPKHIIVYTQDKNDPIGILPCYLKDHSYGEYIFDWSWADAYRRSGLNYYPKLSCATPFTPATAPSWLISTEVSKPSVRKEIINCLILALKALAVELNCSSVHTLFTNQEANNAFESLGFINRQSSQFHWHNRCLLDQDMRADQESRFFEDFDDYLQTMSSRKRKNIKRERRRVAEQGVSFKWFAGEELTEDIIMTMYEFYLSTTYRYGAQQYLTKSFFKYIANKLQDSSHVLLAFITIETEGKTEKKAVAGGLFFSSQQRLYGRYWGANIDIKDLHFETCYYQPIEYAIKQQYEAFEAGAQGQHKLARGLMPVTTYSQHWLVDERFHNAVDEFTKEEAKHICEYNQTLAEHGPFKQCSQELPSEL